MIGLLVGVLAIPKLIELTNRVLEEYVIPRKELQAAAAGKVNLYPMGLDIAVTPEELRKLKKNGSFDILQHAAARHHHLAAAGQADVCEHCQRLS